MPNDQLVLNVKTWPSLFFVGDMDSAAAVQFPAAASRLATAASGSVVCPLHCSARGTCNDGACMCSDGYGGAACDVNVGWRCDINEQGCVPGSTKDRGVYDTKEECETDNDGCGFKYDCSVDKDTHDTSIRRVKATQASIIFGQSTRAEAVNRGCTQRYTCEPSESGDGKTQCIKVSPMDARGVSLDQCNATCWFSSSPAVWPSFYANKDLNLAPAARAESAAEQAFDAGNKGSGSWNCMGGMGCVQADDGLGQFRSRDACERSTNGCGFTYTCAKGKVERVLVRSADTVALSLVEATASCLQQWKCETYVPEGAAASGLSMATASRCVKAEGWETNQALFPNETSCKAGCGFACGGGGGAACTQQYGAQFASRGDCARGCGKFVCNSITGACETFDLAACTQECSSDLKCQEQCSAKQTYANWGLCHVDEACSKDSCPPAGYAPPFPVACPPPRPLWACGQNNTCERQFDTSPQSHGVCSCEKACQNGGRCTGSNACTCASSGWTGAQCETSKWGGGQAVPDDPSFIG